MRPIVFILLSLLYQKAFSQIAEITGSVKDSTEYGRVQNAKLYFIQNDTVIYSGWGGNYNIVLNKSLTDTIVVTHHRLGTIKVPVRLKDKEKLWLDIHFPTSCRSITQTDICPKCQTNMHVVKILYGMPNKKGIQQANAGKIHLGGCMINDCSPLYFCKVDKLEF